MMGDMGEGWDGYRKDRQNKKQANQSNSTQILIDAEINFTSHNGGNHLVVECNDFVVDFWPSTGKFIFRNAQIKGRGVFSLIKRLG